MAKKKKEDLDNNDELNEQNHDDFNEADDSFGLPEVDYEPLEEDEETKSEEAEEASSTQEEETVTYSSDNDDQEESSNEEEQQEEQQEYVPGSYTPPEEESSNVGKVVLLVLILVLTAVGIWYFGFHKPEADRKEQARIEQEQKAEAERIAQQQKAEEERKAQEEADRIAAEEAAAAEEAEPETGVVNTISERTGRYYVVVASAIDGDLAMDYANELAATGKNIDIIPPFGKSKFHRVTVDNQDTWASAENSASELKGEFGDDVWVIRY